MPGELNSSSIELIVPKTDSLYRVGGVVDLYEPGQVSDVVLANEEGPCGGVEMAEDVLDKLVELRQKGADLVIYGNHPPSKGADRAAYYADMGVNFGIPIEEIPVDKTVVYLFSAHGADPSEVKKAEDRNFKVVDTTCPLVGKVYRDIEKFREGLGEFINPEDCAVVFVAPLYDPEHPEVKGTAGVIREAGMRRLIPVTSVDDAKKLAKDLADEQVRSLLGIKRVLVTGMTTNNSDMTLGIARAFAIALANVGYPERFLEPYDERSVCGTVRFRQDAVRRMVAERMVGSLVVVGSLGSNNTNELVEAAKSEADKMAADELLLKRIVYANTHRDLPPDLTGSVGIASGASTQQANINQILERLNVDPPNVIGIGGNTKIGGKFKPMGGPSALARLIVAGDLSWL